MIFDLPSSLESIGYYQGVSLVLWIIVLILLFTLSALFMFKAIKVEDHGPRNGNIAFGLFGLFFGLVRVVFFIGVFNPDDYDFYINIGYIFLIISLLFILYVLEFQVVTNTKKIFFISTLVALFFSLISLIGVASRYLALTFIWLLLPFAASSICLLYLYLIYKTDGVVRKKAALILISIILIMTSFMMDSEAIISSYPNSLEITPTIMIVGILLFIYGQLFIETNE